MKVLKNKNYKIYNQLSRYQTIPYYYNTLDNKYMSGLAKALNKETEYSLYIIQADDTLDSLAAQFYKNPAYYWVIADFNEIRDPYVELIPGALIKIPLISSITFTQKG